VCPKNLARTQGRDRAREAIGRGPRAAQNALVGWDAQASGLAQSNPSEHERKCGESATLGHRVACQFMIVTFLYSAELAFVGCVINGNE